MVQWLARLPGTQEIRGSSPGRGMTDFCTSIFICLYNIYIYINKKVEQWRSTCFFDATLTIFFFFFFLIYDVF